MCTILRAIGEKQAKKTANFEKRARERDFIETPTSNADDDKAKSEREKKREEKGAYRRIIRRARRQFMRPDGSSAVQTSHGRTFFSFLKKTPILARQKATSAAQVNDLRWHAFSAYLAISVINRKARPMMKRADFVRGPSTLSALENSQEPHVGLTSRARESIFNRARYRRFRKLRPTLSPSQILILF